MSDHKTSSNAYHRTPNHEKMQLSVSELIGNIHQFEMQGLVHFSVLENNLHLNIKTYTEYTQTGSSQIDFSTLVEEGRTEPHRHNYYEMVVIMDGTAIVNLDGKQYTFDKGDCYIVNHNIEHYELLTTDFKTLYIHLSNEMAANLLKYEGNRLLEKGTQNSAIWQFLEQQKEGDKKKERSFLFFQPFSNSDSCTEGLFSCINSLVSDFSNKESGYLFHTSANLCKLFSFLHQKKYYRATHHQREAGPAELLFVRLTQEIAFSGGQISWEALREKLNYSPEYLNKVMKRFTNMTINQYAMDLRLEFAVQELIHTEENIEEISVKYGFSNRTYFYKCFGEKYHCTPRQYRERYMQKRD